jgi:PIN domain nuclease of toxin-antitoxin system
VRLLLDTQIVLWELLVAQAVTEPMRLLTCDPLVALYGGGMIRV